MWVLSCERTDNDIEVIVAILSSDSHWAPLLLFKDHPEALLLRSVEAATFSVQ